MCPSAAADDEQAAFLERVGSWIEARLSERDHSFGSLVADLPGVDPTVAAAALRRLAGRPDTRSAAESLLADAEREPATAVVTRERPLPHPLDFYWSHTDASIEAIVSELASVTDSGATIAYLGTPNIFRVAAERMTGRSHVLLDRSVPRTEALNNGAGRVVRLDLVRDELPALDARAAVLDPPWYPEHMCGFLWAAAGLVGDGAEIWASFPPAGTRHSVDQETSDVLKAARGYGLELIERRPDAVRYLSSPFELASHRAARLGGIPRDWRVGELIRLRRTQGAAALRPPPAADEDLWLPFAIEEIPVWVREGRPNGDAIDQGLLHSVSRRDPNRRKVDIWTSLNRVWASKHPLALQAICRALAERSDSLAAVQADLSRELEPAERKHVRAVADHLSGIVKREREEHGL